MGVLYVLSLPGENALAIEVFVLLGMVGAN